MDDLDKYRKELIHLVTKNEINKIISTLKSDLIKSSENFKNTILLESTINEIKRKANQGILSNDEIVLQNNNYRKRIIDILFALQVNDFQAHIENNIFVDERDGYEYETIKIAGRIWMAENLRFNIGEGTFWYNNDEWYKNYGRLYTWQAAQDACPNGWKIPNDEDWINLLMHFGGYRDNLKNIFKSIRVGSDLKGAYNALRNGGDSGFDVVLAGAGKNMNGQRFYNRGHTCKFWSSSTSSNILGVRNYFFFKDKEEEVHRDSFNENWLNYCRCIKID